MAKRKKKSPADATPLETLPQLNLNAAGLDIGAEEIYACVPADRDKEPIRIFATFTADLYALADWLEACGIETVAMESTGVYWTPVYELDCQWIQQLHTFGLLRASFRPPEEICALRALARHRDNLIRYRSARIQHMQKALQMMNVKLTQVVSDITGVTGMSIIRAIVAGERDPGVLAGLRNPKCAKSEAEIAKALEGNYKPEHLFVLKQALAQYDFYQQQIQECDAELEAMYAALPPADDQVSSPPKPQGSKPRKNQAHFDLATSLHQMMGVDLTAIDGLDALTVQEIIAEIGVDMSPWPTVKHFTSWLCLAPYNDKTGGKVVRSGTKKTQNRANTTLRIAAQSLSRSQSALGAFYRRMRAKLGPAKANKATAHKLARIVYHMLKYREPYVDPGEAYYEQQYWERAIRNLKRKAAQLAMQLVPAAAQVPVVS